MRKPLIVGNWKMNYGIQESLDFMGELLASYQKTEVQVVVASPDTSLYVVSQKLLESPIALAGQNMHFEKNGAFTGETSPCFLKELNCEYVLLGHSERRQYFGESDGKIRRKILAALELGLTPIYCVGESLEIREAGEEISHITGQLDEGLQGLNEAALAKLVIAYEPIWAIGTGKTASPEQAEAVHLAIRSYLKDKSSQTLADSLQILYGGSVKAANAGSLMVQENIDGLLVGGASLNASEFLKIVQEA